MTMTRAASRSVRRSVTLLLAVMVLVIAPGCRREAAFPPGGDAGVKPALDVFVSIPPQEYFVTRVGGDRVQVNVLVTPGQDPHTFEPIPTQMAALAEADVFFRVGMPFEDGLLSRISASMPNLHVVDTREGITLRDMSEHGADEERGAKDPHIWLAPRLVITQARTIADELARLDPAGAQFYEGNRAEFARELLALQAQVADTLRPVRTHEMLVFHPSFGYFADAFGLKQVSIEVEGKEPGPRELQQMIERARQAHVPAIFVEPQFSTAAAQAVAREVHARLVTLDPLAEDYPQNMREMARKIAEALGQPTLDRG